MCLSQPNSNWSSRHEAQPGAQVENLAVIHQLAEVHLNTIDCGNTYRQIQVKTAGWCFQTQIEVLKSKFTASWDVELFLLCLQPKKMLSRYDAIDPPTVCLSVLLRAGVSALARTSTGPPPAQRSSHTCFSLVAVNQTQSRATAHVEMQPRSSTGHFSAAHVQHAFVVVVFTQVWGGNAW